MKIRVISDLHLDVNEGYPFSLKGDDKNVFALVAGDVAGNVKLAAKWMKENVKDGMFICGNHDPAYNDSGLTIKTQKMYLHEHFPLEKSVTFLDEQVGVMSKLIPGTNILVIGSTLYTDYKYISKDALKYHELNNKGRRNMGENEVSVEEVNMGRGYRGLNDFRWGHTEDETDERGLKQRRITPEDYLKWFNATIQKIDELVKLNSDKDIIVMSHHCPSPCCLSSEYVESNMNASYISDLEKFITDRPNIKAWVCGHVHNTSITELGENKQLIVCNPRGYESHFESKHWNPNTFIDTETWKVVVEDYKPTKELEAARKKAYDRFMKYAPMFFI